MAEITVSGGVFATLTPIFTLWYGHKDITYDIAPYVTSISYSDSIKNEADVIAIALEDTCGRWINDWYPGKGDTLALKLGYQEKICSIAALISLIKLISAPRRRRLISTASLPRSAKRCALKTARGSRKPRLPPLPAASRKNMA